MPRRAATPGTNPEIAGIPITGLDHQAFTGVDPTPMTLPKYIDTHRPSSDVLGYTPLGTGIDGTRFLPNASEHLVDGSPGSQRTLGVGGTVAILEIPYTPGSDALHQPSETISVVDGDWGPGRVYAQGQELKSRAANRVDPLRQFDGIIGVFRRVDRQNPLYPNSPSMKLDWELATLLTTGDSFPVDLAVDDRFAGGKYETFVNSQLNGPEARYLEENGGKRKVGDLLDGVIDFGGRLVKELQECSSKTKRVALEEVIAAAMKKTQPAAKEFINNYLAFAGYNPFELRVFARAHAILEDAEKQASGKKDHREYLDHIRRHQRKEVLQAFLHRQTALGVDMSLRARATANNHPFISPFPFSVTLYDAFDFEFAGLLGRVNAGEYQEKIAGMLENGFKQDPGKIPYHGILSIRPTQKSHPLLVADSFHGPAATRMDSFQYSGQCLPLDSPGSTVLEMGRSFYRRGGKPLVDGVIGRWGTGTETRGQLTHPAEYLALDLMKTPGRLLRHVINSGILTGDRQDAPSGQGLLLSEMLKTSPGSRELVVLHTTLGGMVAKGVIAEGTGIHWVQPGGNGSREQTRVAPEPTVAIKAHRIESRRRSPLESIRRQIELSGKVAVAGTTGLTKDGAGIPIAGAFMKNGIPHVMQRRNVGPGDGASVVVMPNEFVRRSTRS